MSRTLRPSEQDLTLGLCVRHYRKNIGVLKALLSPLKPECQFRYIFDYELDPSLTPDTETLRRHLVCLERINHYRQEFFRLQSEAGLTEDEPHRTARELFEHMHTRALDSMAALANDMKKKKKSSKKKNKDKNHRRFASASVSVSKPNPYSSLTTEGGDEDVEKNGQLDDFPDLFLPTAPEDEPAPVETDDQLFDRMKPLVDEEREEMKSRISALLDKAEKASNGPATCGYLYFDTDLSTLIPQNSLVTSEYFNVAYVCRHSKFYRIEIRILITLLDRIWPQLPNFEILLLHRLVTDAIDYFETAYAMTKHLFHRAFMLTPIPIRPACIARISSDNQLPSDFVMPSEIEFCPLCSVLMMLRRSLVHHHVPVHCTDLHMKNDLEFISFPFHGGLKFLKIEAKLEWKIMKFSAALKAHFGPGIPFPHHDFSDKTAIDRFFLDSMVVDRPNKEKWRENSKK